jgi:hypothetical protein
MLQLQGTYGAHASLTARHIWNGSELSMTKLVQQLAPFFPTK